MILENYLELADRTGIVPFLWGDPGVGKTARIEQWAKAKGYHLERLVLSQHDPTEVVGIYVATEGARRAERAVPAWLARVLEASQQGRRAVVFFDELTTAAPAVQDTALGIFNERVVGDVPLPQDTILVAAANPPERARGACGSYLRRLPTASCTSTSAPTSRPGGPGPGSRARPTGS